jgi:uncharacterized protein (TIGR03084 family)
MSSGADARAAVEEVARDLAAEEQALDDLVAALDEAGWSKPTPAQGWDVRANIGHLASSEELASLAATDEAAFRARLQEALENLEEFSSGLPGDLATLSPHDLLERWRGLRTRTIDAVRATGPDERIPWVGPSMRGRAFLTARLMETWAHGRDVFDALGATQPATDRLRHIAHLGVITRSFAYANRGLEAPDVEVRVELGPPDGGEPWVWGPVDAADRVTGSAEDFCLVVTQRRNAADTDLRVEGPAARDWIDHAQCFAGPPTEPPLRGRASGFPR